MGLGLGLGVRVRLRVRLQVRVRVAVARTGASSMQRRWTGASSRSKHCSEMAAEMVAPTPPDCVLSSRMATWLRLGVGVGVG